MIYKKPKKLLLQGGNAKLDKNEIVTYGLSLAPYTMNYKGKNLCPLASKGCSMACLNDVARGKFSNVRQARINKSNYYLADRQMFIEQLAHEIDSIAKRKAFAMRLNVYSDQDFVAQLQHVGMDLLEDPRYKDIVLYDYTAIPGKVKKYLGTKYYHALSRKEDNEKNVEKVLAMGGTAAVVFRHELPDTYKGYRVVDGDVSDLVMTRETNVVLGLRAKGKEAKNDTTGFIVN